MKNYAKRKLLTMKFSIIVPVYNGENTLRRCVQSILKQTDSDWELILVDDGSTDRSRTVADRCAEEDRRIHVIGQQNSGQLLARREGLKKASGEYVLFLDCDDYWKDNCLAVLREIINREKTDVIFFRAERVGETRHKGEKIPANQQMPLRLEKDQIIQTLIRSVDFNSMCLKAWKRELFTGDETDYSRFSGTCWGEDKAQLLYPITRARTFFSVPDALYCYVDNPDSVIHDMDPTRIRNKLAPQLYDMLHSYVKIWGMDTPENREWMAVQYLRHYLSVYYRLRKNADSARRRKLRAYPWKEIIPPSVMRYVFSKKLTGREKLKILLAYYVHV